MALPVMVIAATAVCALSGGVHGTDGAPVRAHVVASGPGYWAADTDPEGHFELNLPCGAQRLSVTALGYASADVEVQTDLTFGTSATNRTEVTLRPINIDWPYIFLIIGTTTSAIAAFAAVAVLRRLRLVHGTNQLKQRQVDAEEAERGMRPRLVVREKRSIRNDKGDVETTVRLERAMNSVRLYMEVENEGNRKATNISVEFLLEGIKGVNMDQGIAVTDSGYTKNRVPGELAPGDHTLIGIVNGSAETSTARIKWIARCNEGSFPQKDDSSNDPWGEIIVRFVQP